MSPVAVGDVKADTSNQFARLFANRRLRTSVEKIMAREATEVVAAGEAISETDLHRRPDNRRSPMSLAHGKEYHDSWGKTAPVTTDTTVTIRVGNAHPAAHIVEGGSDPHIITARSPAGLAFPFNGGAPGAPNRKGGFAVAYGSAPTVRPGAVKHPGAVAHRIMYRAVVRWKSRSRLKR